MGLNIDLNKLLGGETKEKKRTALDDEKILAMVRASLKEYGTIVPPKEVLYAVATATCPHCGETGSLKEMFGMRHLRNGTTRPQSWCRSCRNSPDSHPARES